MICRWYIHTFIRRERERERESCRCAERDHERNGPDGHHHIRMSERNGMERKGEREEAWVLAGGSVTFKCFCHCNHPRL